ncbi:hypothetical protein SCUCBS95973_005328 [Sporothrix curviconia]|uniref:Phosphatidylethanolamine-binding protein n=1 Tax=Sporothrix curviconia TaxID=1260050 RepID=A0ABP0BW53_9PEZI
MVSTIVVLAAAAASVVSASTPPGFEPAVRTQLVVDYGNTLINGQVVPKSPLVVTNQPQIGIQQRRFGSSSFTVIMVDLDIPTNNAGETTTLLHWMQMGLSASPQASRVGAVGGGTGAGADAGADAAAAGGPSTDAVEIAFLLRNASTQAPAAAYISPNPPARLPLSHTYAQFLVDTTGVTAQSSAMQVLMAAAQTRQGFNVQQVLQRAGLSNNIVAANFFNVTNPGPVQSDANQQQQQQDGSPATGSTSGDNSTSESSTPSSSSGTSTTTYGSSGIVSDTSSSTTAASGNVVKASGASLSSVSVPVVALVGIVAIFSAL